ncbi:peptidylprolyl isomerase [Phormidium sp. FACHB-592]|uniref:peptidylprolyl isomerase n=1 Tax=Stenomitos frigidus AS-A4 TaxID=2933935 RepID=A0ABV0KN08_9CYAN|nr:MULTISPECIES: peptidylprolyl isomerase [Cyanophyceae]MBD2035454.1 peptidylprolyl isomerase [Leptolyngbya sp. FACHB-321]MBD2074383.1 peptidylprolyl isomerase [Phormidium sp. FACHB-592]
MELQAAESKALLVVDEQPLSLRQCLRHLQAAGKLQAFVGDILRQYVLEQSLATRQDIEISPAIVEQAVIDFRLQQQLTDSKVFQEWLNRNGLSYEQFHTQIMGSFKLEKLKAQVTNERLQEYFIERKIFFDRVVLSRIVVASKELAEELQSQIAEGANFEQLAREYSTADERVANGMMGPVSRGTLPDALRAAIDSASPGELVGPLEFENFWAIFRVEQFLPATLEDNQLRQAMQNELFEKWLSEKIQTMTVKLQVNE